MSTNGPHVDAVLFDFDGVILDTVALKEHVFREMMAEHAPEKLDEVMGYYWANGGVSRLEKFRWIWSHILHQPLSDSEVAQLGKQFSQRVYQQVVRCQFVRGAELFLNEYFKAYPLFVISGTPEPELRSVVRDRGIEHFFRGVYGSPENKVEIGNRIIDEHGYIRERLWFVGDATTDRDAARALGVRFVGLNGPHLTPFLDGREITIDDLTQLAGVLHLPP